MSGPEEARSVFSAAHAIYIPLCVLAGLFLGWLLGARGSRAEVARLRKLLEEEEARAQGERLARLDGPSARG
jgi:hypothetical protein